MTDTLRVDLWSDVVCPYCYIGSAQLATALELFDGDVEVHHHAFELDPSAPPSSADSLPDLLATKYGISRERALAMNDRLAAQGSEFGLTFSFSRVRPANSLDAHRLLALAATQGRDDSMRERLFRAYFADGLLISDPATLTSLAEEVGVTGARELWGSDEFVSAVRDDERRAHELRLTGVPAFVIDERYLVSGAQGSAALVAALVEARAAREA